MLKQVNNSLLFWEDLTPKMNTSFEKVNPSSHTHRHTLHPEVGEQKAVLSSHRNSETQSLTRGETSDLKFATNTSVAMAQCCTARHGTAQRGTALHSTGHWCWQERFGTGLLYSTLHPLSEKKSPWLVSCLHAPQYVPMPFFQPREVTRSQGHAQTARVFQSGQTSEQVLLFLLW